MFGCVSLDYSELEWAVMRELLSKIWLKLHNLLIE